MDAESIQTLLAEIERKDASTAAHTWRVVLYTLAMAEEAGLAPDRIRKMAFAAALHDVGKIDIPGDLLRKPGPLDADEYAAMQTHAALGHYRLLTLGETDPALLALVRHHHERWDGRGYPDGLAREQIHYLPRYFSVIDSFDAMTSIRPYRAEVGAAAGARAINELKAGAGTRYCPEAVEMFVTLHTRGSLDWIMEYYNDSCPLPPLTRLENAGSLRVAPG